MAFGLVCGGVAVLGKALGETAFAGRRLVRVVACLLCGVCGVGWVVW